MTSILSVQITSEVYPAHTTHEDCVEKFKKRGNYTDEYVLIN